jgi:hypothetical protein
MIVKAQLISLFLPVASIAACRDLQLSITTNTATMGIELTTEDENDFSFRDLLRDFGEWDESIRSLNSSMSSVTMFTGDFHSHGGDSMSTIRTYDLQAPDVEDQMCFDPSNDNRPRMPGRCSSYRSMISELSPTSTSDLSPTYPRRFSDSTKESTDTIPVIPK